MTLKPLVLHGKGPTPNPIKVAILLEELGLPFTTNKVNLTNGEHKQEPFINLNPNGRLPALEDPNTGIVLFEVSPIPQFNMLKKALIEPVWCHHRVPNRDIRQRGEVPNQHHCSNQMDSTILVVFPNVRTRTLLWTDHVFYLLPLGG